MNNTTKDINEQIVSLRKSGMNIREVSEKLSVTYDKVKYVLDKAGLQNHKYSKTCEHCNDDYKTLSHQSKFCSDRCRLKYNKIKKSDRNKQICEHCQQVFYKYKRQRYCSKECRHKHTISKKRIKMIRGKCKHCNKEYRKIGGRRKTFCNDFCWYAYTFVSKERKHNIKCKECGQHKTVSFKRKVFCSDECLKKFTWRCSELKRRKRITSNGSVHWDISICHRSE